MDEPTTGLHPEDIDRFIRLLYRLREAGHTLIVVEHNPQLIRACDWVIDLGPQGGDQGGQLMFAGEPPGLKIRRRQCHSPLFVAGIQRSSQIVVFLIGDGINPDTERKE